MPLTVGGGVRTLEDIRALLKAGADKVSINTAAVQRPEFVKEAAELIRDAMYRRSDRRQASRCAVGRVEVFTHGGTQVDRSRCRRMGEDDGAVWGR